VRKQAEQLVAKKACEVLQKRFESREIEEKQDECVDEWTTVSRKPKLVKSTLTSLSADLRAAYKEEGCPLLEKMGVVARKVPEHTELVHPESPFRATPSPGWNDGHMVRGGLLDRHRSKFEPPPAPPRPEQELDWGHPSADEAVLAVISDMTPYPEAATPLVAHSRWNSTADPATDRGIRLTEL
jgi:hypothetical protein